MNKRETHHFFFSGSLLPACLNFWHYKWERCLMSIRKTSWSHAFCFIFKPLTSKNIKNKWSISKTLIVVSCVYLIYWPNRYIFTILFFTHPQYISLQWSYEVLQWFSAFLENVFLEGQNQDLKQHPHSFTHVYLEHNRKIS